jgi:hypothetical protein
VHLAASGALAAVKHEAMELVNKVKILLVLLSCVVMDFTNL